MVDPLTAIAENVDALSDPRQHAEPRWTWDTNRNKKPLPPHITTLPGLIQQLRELIPPGSADPGPGVRSIPDSRPPLVLSAVSLLAAIEYGAAKRVLDLGLTPRGSAEANLRAIVGAASVQPSDVQQVIALEVRSWRSQAEIVCRWRSAAVDLRSPCPATVLDPRSGERRQCGARTVVANPDTYAAWCLTCGAEWAPDDFEALRAQLVGYRNASLAAAERVRGEVRERKLAAVAAEQAAREGRNGGRDAA